jgi:MFS family permease
MWAIGCLGFAICYTLLIAMRAMPDPLLLCAMVLTQGALGYGITSVMGAVVVEIFEGPHFGSVLCTVIIGAVSGGAVGSWTTGMLHNHSGTYTSGFALALLFSLLSALAIWKAAPRRVRTVAGQSLG